MFCSPPGLLDIKAFPKGSLQGMDLAGQPDRSARPGTDSPGSDFFCMLQAAGLDADVAGKISENWVMPEALSENDLQDWILNLIGELETSDCPQCTLEAAIEDAESAGIFRQWIYSDDSGGQKPAENIQVPENIQVAENIQIPEDVQVSGTGVFSDQGQDVSAGMFAGLSDSGTSKRSDDSLAAGLEAFLKQYASRSESFGENQTNKTLLSSGNEAPRAQANPVAEILARLQTFFEKPAIGSESFGENQTNKTLLSSGNEAPRAQANPMTEILQAFTEKYANKADGRDVAESLRLLLQSATQGLKNGHAGLRDTNKNPDQSGGSSSFLLNTDILKQVSDTEAGFKNAAAPMANGADVLSEIKPNQIVMQELVEKHSGNTAKPEAELWLRQMPQPQDKVFSEQNPANTQNANPRQDPGLQNIREMLEALVSGNTEKMENSRPVIRENGPASFAANDSGTAGSAMFQKAENAVSTIQPGGASFDTQLKAAESQVVNQVSVRLFTGVRQGSGNMTIQINPPELGSVKVKIISDQGSLNVHLHPQSQQVAAILERNLPALHQSLADQGIDLAGLDVSVDSGGDQDTSQFKEQAEDWLAGKNNMQAEPSVDENSPVREDRQASYVNGRGLSLRV